MSSSLFAPLGKYFPSLKSPRARAITIVLSLLVFSFAMGSIALSTRHKYLPLAVLGIIYGVLSSYPATELLGPRMQSAIGGALSGFSMGNIVHRFNHTLSSIELLGQWMADAVQQALAALQINFQADYLKDGIVLCICMAIVTMLLIIIISAYLENDGFARLDAHSHPDESGHGMAQVAGGS